MFGFVKYLLEQPEANSRFVFLMQSVASAVAVVLLAVAYIHAGTTAEREGYVSMMATVMGGGSLLHLGRFLTKKVGPAQMATIVNVAKVVEKAAADAATPAVGKNS